MVSTWPWVPWRTASTAHCSLVSTSISILRTKVIGQRGLECGRCSRRFFDSNTAEYWTQRFAGSDACVAPVVSMTSALRHPQIAARGSIIEKDGIMQPGCAPRFSRTTRPGGTPPRPGEHTREVLRDFGVTGVDELLQVGRQSKADPELADDIVVDATGVVSFENTTRHQKFQDGQHFQDRRHAVHRSQFVDGAVVSGPQHLLGDLVGSGVARFHEFARSRRSR